MRNRIIIYSVLGISAFLGLAWLLSDIFAYIIISLVIASILKGPTSYLSQIQFFGIKLPKTLAIIISFCILFSFATLFVYLFVPLITNQIKVLASIDYEHYIEKAIVPIEYIENLIIENDIFKQEKGFLIDSLKDSLMGAVNPSKVSKFINGLLSFTGNFFIGLLAVLFISFFFLYEKGLIRKYFISSIPNKYFEVSIAAWTKTEKLLSNYLLGLLIQMTVVFTIVATGLLIVGVDYAVTIALFAAVANLVPFLGPVIGATFGLFVGLASPELVFWQDYVIMMIKIAAVFGVVQVTDNAFIQPIIFSKSVKAHPLVIFLIVFVGGSLMGPIGMILAIPTFTIVKVAFDEFYRGFKKYQVFRS